MFDSETLHFSRTVPHKALKNDPLLRACISASAKQYHLITSTDAHHSIMLYDVALQSLQTHLNDEAHMKEDTTFAACLLLAWNEMVDNNTQDWGMHLRGAKQIVDIGEWHKAQKGLGNAV